MNFEKSPPTELTIVTRESRLAMWQAHHVQSRLQALGHRITIVGMTTRGDQILDRSLSKLGGKGLFVKELEAALLEGRADIAVHSLKDVPMELPEGLALSCVLEREDARDAWVSNQYDSLAQVPQGALIGTSSLRRQMLLQALRPDLVMVPLRGNLDTRLRKLDEGHFAGIVLAAAGLKRLGYGARIRTIFSTQEMLPAVGQGALALETRTPRQLEPWASSLHRLHHQPTYLCVMAERALSRALGGSCSMPLAGYAHWEPESGSEAKMRLHAAFWSEKARRLLRAQAVLPVETVEQADKLGALVAQYLQKDE